ncbi:MAG: tripartite tricarboxylate transporter permease [Nitrospinota bacterium]|nr:tripartite tricarboxylate transporter permease [Nitrospinota bacterium]
MEQVFNAIWAAITLQALVMVSLGVFAGITVGAIPGLTSVMAIAVLVPFSFFMTPINGIPFLLGIHKGALFGGSIPSVLINTPGTAAAAATSFDGYPLAQKGEAKSAIQMALYSSTLGDSFSDIVLIVAAFPLAAVALLFGPTEFFALMVMGLTIISAVTGSSVLKGLLSMLIGILIGLIGQDIISGAERFTFGIGNIMDGVGTVPMLIGLFAVSEVLIQSEKKLSELSTPPETAYLKGGRSLDLKELVNVKWTIMRSSFIGTAVGAIPGTGAAIATFISYALAKRGAKRPEEFGKGSYEGIAAAEAANSAVAGADLIPTLAFGIPGSASAAILMGAFMAQGLRPGPNLFQEHAATMYGIFTLLLLGNPIMLLQGKLLTPLFARIVTVRQSLLVPIILLFCVVGGFIYQNSIEDVKLALFFGLVGYGLRKLNFPLAPLVIAYILTASAEESMKQALVLSDGDFFVFLTRPISAFFIFLSVALLGMAVWKRPWADN